MAFDVDGARQAGYTDDEIASFLAPQLRFDLKGAVAAGYTAPEIVDHLSTMKPVVTPPQAATEPTPTTDPMGNPTGLIADSTAAAPAVSAPAEQPDASDEQTIGQKIAKGSEGAIYKSLGGALDALWGMAQSGERKATQGRNVSDLALEATPIVGPALRPLQDMARILMPKDDAGKVKRAEIAEKLDDAAEAMAPAIQKESFDDAVAKGHVLEWMVVQAAAQSPQVATILASILVPAVAPAALPSMGFTAGGNQYAEDIKAGVPQDKAALDATINGLTEIASEAVGYKIGTGAGAIYERVLAKIPEESRKAAASTILARLAAGGATLGGAAVTEGAGEAAGQVVQDLSQKYIAERDPGDMGENARTAFFASLLPGALFAAPHTAAHAVEARKTNADRIGDAFAQDVDGTQFAPGSAEAIARDRLNPEGAQHTAATVPLAGALDAQLDAIMKAPITPIEDSATGPMPTGGEDDLASMGLSAAPQTFDFQTSFPQPLDGSGIAPEQSAQSHGDVIDTLRAARDAGEEATYGHVLDAYRGAFGDAAANQLDRQIRTEVSDERSRLQPDEAARGDAASVAGPAAAQGESDRHEAPARSAGADGEEVGGGRAAPVEGEAGAPAATAGNARAVESTEDGQPARGASHPADVQGEQAGRVEGAVEAEEDQGIEDFQTRRGEVKTFKSAKAAEHYRDQGTNRVPKNFKARQTEDGWVLSRPKRERTPAQRANDRRLALARARIDPARDSLATMLGKLGGIQADELLRDGIDAKSLRELRSGVVGKPAYRRKGGLSLDGLAELLDQYGFDLRDEHGAIDSTKLRDLIQSELDGSPVYTPEGYENLASMEAEARSIAERMRRENDFSEDDLRRAGYDDLSEAAQAFVQAVFHADADTRLAATDIKESLTDEEADRIFDEWTRAVEGDAEGAAPGRAGESHEDGKAAARDEGEPPQGSVAPEAATTETPPDGGVSASGLELTGETEQQIRDREAKEKAAAAERDKADKAPPASDFTLTGSTRAVDEARARGQRELGEAEPSTGYTAAKAKADEASRKFAQAQQAYRAKKIGDAEFLAARQEHDRAQAEFDRAFEQESKGKPIGDFGEKIGGARKDVWASMREAMEKAATVDVEAQPLSKSWPAPDYSALLEGGADPWSVGFMHAARDAVPAKPRQPWKVKRWAGEVRLLRDFSFALVRGTMSAAEAKHAMTTLTNKSRAMEGIASRIDLYMLVGHAKSLEGVRVSSGSYSVFDGKNYDPPKVIWSVEKEAAATAFSNWPRMLATGDTREEALAKFKAAYDSIELTKPRSEEVSFDIYSKSREDGFWIGKKMGRNPLMLAGPFATVKEARTYKSEHQAELEQKLAQAREVPNERRTTNEPRIGVDMRNAQDVTPQLFAETFGFRGVEFGNWVEQGRRQKDLNDAFDALMDMAAVLGVPPRALSLNGELGLAFGARGSGGKNAAAAHYEPGRVVINLTKVQGSGSLGHEWWHALDNYFSRMRSQPDSYASEALDTSLASRGSKYVHQGEVRREMVDAFGKVVRSIMDTALRARSSKLDARRTKEYWTTTREMTARAFESYLISKLQDQSASNDYLANIVDEKTWAAAEALGFELDGSYPYPTAGEVPAIRAGFDHFFQTVLTKDTDQGTALYSRSSEQVRIANIDALSKELKPIVREAPNGLPIVANRWVALSKPRSPQNLGGGDRRVTFTIYDRTNLEAGKATPVGALIADVDRHGLFKAIRAIEIHRQFRQQGLGFGERTVAMMIAHNGGVPIEVVDIQHAGKEDTPDDALPFWRKMGVQLRNISADPNVEMDGVIDRTRYLNALDARGKVWNDGSLTRNDRDAQAARGAESEGAQPDAGGEAGGPARREGSGERGSDEQLPPKEPGKLKRADRVDEAPGRGLSTSAAESIAKRLGIQARIADSEAGLPAHLQQQIEEEHAEGEVRGVYDPRTGEVWLVRANLNSEDEALFVALHESAHRGLAALFGKDLRPVLGHIYVSNKAVRTEANRLMERFGYSQARATEEVLADMAGRGQARNLKGWERFVAFVRKWLVDRGFNLTVTDAMAEFIAGAAAEAGKTSPHVFGAADSANFSRDERAKLHELYDRLAEAQRQEEAFWHSVRRGGDFKGGSKEYEAERDRVTRAVDQAQAAIEMQMPNVSDARAITRTPEFKRWFGDSKVVDDEGRPRVVYHGTDAEEDFSTFDTMDFGSWFAESPSTADDHAGKGRGGDSRMMPVYLSVKRPLRVPSGIDLSSEYAVGDTLRAINRENGTHFKPADFGFKAGYVGNAFEWIAQEPKFMEMAKAAGFDGIYAYEQGAPTWNVFESAQIKSAVGNTGAFDPRNEDIRFSRKPTGNAKLDSFDQKAGLIRTEATLASRARDLMSAPMAEVRNRMKQSLVDRFHGIQQAEARLGNLPAEQSGYVAARLSTGVPSVMRFLMTFGQVEWRDGVLSRKADGKGLLEIFQPVRDDFDDFIRWMVAKRAERLLGDSKERNFTADEIREALKASAPNEERYKAVAREFAAFKRSVLDVAEKAGLIDGTTRPMWDQADWIPFYRVVEGDGVKGPGGKKGLSGQTSGIRTLKGGEAALNDPLGNIVMNFSHLIDASMKNNALARVIENLGEDKSVMEPIGLRSAPALVPLSQIRKVLLEQGVAADVVDAIPKDALAGIQKMWSIVPPSDPDVVRVMRGGKAEYWRINDPLLLRALTAVQGAGQLWSRYLRPFKTVLTRAVTAAPDFMARNFLRDAMQAWTIDKNGFVAGIDSVRGLAKSLKKEGGMLDMMAAGASFAGGYTFGTDPEATAQAIRRSLRAKGWKATDIDSYVATVIDTPTKLLEAWEEIGSAVENANREAVFEAASRAGKSRAESIYTAKDLMDYSMMGDAQAIAMLNDLLPFFNARLQGLYKLGRAAAEDPKRVAIRGLVLTLATLAILGGNWDRDKYEELEEWDKDSYWHFWVAGRHLRIPKPFEVGFIFGTVPERIMRAIGGKDPWGKAAKQLAIGIRDQLAMNPTPQVVSPITELVANKDFFTGRPIEGMADEGKLPHARYSEQTSETMRAIANLSPAASDALGLSPKRLEHLWNGYLGTVGMYALGLSDLAARRATGAPEKPALRADDLPVVKAFLREDPARGTIFKTELYDLRTQADQAFNTVNAQIKEGNAPAAIEEAKRNEKQLAVRGVLDSGAQTVTDLGQMIDTIYRDRSLTAAQKREQVDILITQQNRVAEETVRAVRPHLR